MNEKTLFFEMVLGTRYLVLVWYLYVKSKLLELVQYILQPLLPLSGHYIVFSDETLTATAYFGRRNFAIPIRS